MKTLIIALALASSLSAFSQSQDYVCDVRNYRVEVNLTGDTSTSFVLYERNSHSTIAQGYAGFVKKDDGVNTYSFYPGNADAVKLSFRTADVENFPASMRGYIETKARGFLLWDYMSCSKRN